MAGCGHPGPVCAGAAYAWHADSLKLRLLRSKEFSSLQDPNTHRTRDSSSTGISLPSRPTFTTWCDLKTGVLERSQSLKGRIDQATASAIRTYAAMLNLKGRHITTELFRSPATSKKREPAPEPPVPAHDFLDEFTDPY